MRKKSVVLLIVLLFSFLFAAGCKGQAPLFARASASPEPTAVPVQTAVPTATPVPIVLTPSPTPKVMSATGSVYTIAWLSDPQYYSKYGNGVFECMTSYLAEHAKELNLAYIINTGDLVHNTKNEEQWATASKAMSLIDHLPNGVCAGNHDVGTYRKDRDYTYFCRYFGEERYADKIWYGGSYADNKDHYDIINAGNTEYLFVYLGYQVDPEDLEWACGVFDMYPERVGILCTHDYLMIPGTLSEYGQMIYDGVVAKCSNVYAVLCGHRYASNCIPVEIDDDGDGTEDRTVLQMICNYQAIGKKGAKNTGGDGYIRLWTVDEDEGVIRYTSYSPYLDDYLYFDEPEHQHEKYAFNPDKEQGVIPIPWLTEKTTP